MQQRFCTVTKKGHNRFSTYIDKGMYFLKCVHVEGDVDYGLNVVGITQDAYEELYEAYLSQEETDEVLRAVAGYMFWKKTK